jgi:mannose-6-phosphate isomerase-like protein (cupin superfamily)
MPLNGLRLSDPRTGLVAHVLDADDERGRRFTYDYILPPGSPHDVVPRHRHATWTERFEVIEGEGRCRIGNEERALAVGDAVEVPPGIPHDHPWNTGAGTLRVRQTTTLHEPDPEAVRDTFHSFAMVYWLNRQGKAGPNGLPASPLQGAVIEERLQRHGGTSETPLPLWLQRPLFRALAAFGRRRGYRAFDPAALDPVDA